MAPGTLSGVGGRGGLLINQLKVYFDGLTPVPGSSGWQRRHCEYHTQVLRSEKRTHRERERAREKDKDSPTTRCTVYVELAGSGQLP